jgi:hypothetical protein
MKGAIWKKNEPAPKLWMEKLRLSTRTVVENENDLKGKRLLSPQQLTFCLTVNVRDMNVICPGLTHECKWCYCSSIYRHRTQPGKNYIHVPDIYC